MVYLFFDIFFEFVNFGVSCGFDFLSWIIGLLEVELERVNVFVRGY